MGLVEDVVNRVEDVEVGSVIMPGGRVGAVTVAVVESEVSSAMKSNQNCWPMLTIVRVCGPSLSDPEE